MTDPVEKLIATCQPFLEKSFGACPISGCREPFLEAGDDALARKVSDHLRMKHNINIAPAALKDDSPRA